MDTSHAPIDGVEIASFSELQGITTDVGHQPTLRTTVMMGLTRLVVEDGSL